MRIGLINSSDVATAIRSICSQYSTTCPCSTRSASESRSSAFAGVGSPENSLLCVVSMLNFARRSTENAAMMSITYLSGSIIVGAIL